MDESKVIVFQLQNEEYCIPVHQVQGIERMEYITRVPGTHPFVRGVINLRGVVTPIIDLRKRLHLGESEYKDSTRIIIVSVGDIEVGLIVDAANDVLDLPMHQVELPPDTGEVNEEYLQGVVKVDNRLLILLNLEKVLEQEKN
ncbi:chemotaxis protein CheW [Massilibacterium senegalense]|uniref:chemotaxis protein CheW n=1 Tax=Massilibacterium senegalense TaxID=1632858 RepID=UPI001C9C571D|nr:chemotaxis protein CheW [Massilibacterium senegalense]